MGGLESPYFAEFKKRFVQAFKVARMQASFVGMLLEMMSHKSNFPAFRSAFSLSFLINATWKCNAPFKYVFKIRKL